LIDYHLPDGTGLELCLLIRTFDLFTPIFFCTATSSITETQAKRAGAQKLIKHGSMFVSRLQSAVSQAFSGE
jgi:CheY-like chemotaxis protein